MQPSASFSTRGTSLEAGGGSVPPGTVSGSAQLASNISGSFNKGFEFSGALNTTGIVSASFVGVSGSAFAYA